MERSTTNKRIRTLLKAAYMVLVTALILLVLEAVAIWLGLGDPVLYYNDAWGGLRPLPNQQVERLRGATVTIDANGFRSAQPASPGALRILYIGDSVTWGGTSVTDIAVFTEVAADVLRADGQEVYAMNAGVNGTSLVNQAEVFHRHADEADAVVWLFPWGDVERTYAVVGALWPARYRPRFALVEAVDHVLFRFWTNLLRERPPPAHDFRTPEGPAGYEAFFADVLAARQAKNLDAARAVVAEAQRRNLPIILGVTPYRDGPRLEPLTDDARHFIEDMEALGVPIFDASAVLEQASGDMEPLFIDHVHFEVAGHRAVGEALGALLHTHLPSSDSLSIWPNQP